MKEDKITFNHGKIVNIYTVYELKKFYSKTSPLLLNCLFGAVSLTKNADIDKCRYGGYGIGFDKGGFYLLPSGRFARIVIILGKGPMQGLGEHSLTAEKMY